MVNFLKNDTGSEKSLECLVGRFGVNLKCESMHTDMDMLAYYLIYSVWFHFSFHIIFFLFSI